MAHPDRGIDRFIIQFKRTTSLPCLPQSAAALIRIIDSGEASALEIERIIASDPGLVTMILRVAASRMGTTAPTSLRIAILRVGLREIRSIAISLAVKKVLHDEPACNFDATRYARHSLYVGFLSRYLAARRQRVDPFESQWSADELFAAGVLHDIAIPLLARVAPEDFQRVDKMARRMNESFRLAFRRVYDCELSELGALVASMWELPRVFSETMMNMHTPWRIPGEEVSLGALSYADYLANEFGAGIETWDYENVPVLEAELEVGIPPEERENLHEAIERHVSALIEPLTRDSGNRAA